MGQGNATGGRERRKWRSVVRNPYPWIVLAMVALGTVLTVPAPLANDIRYEAGTHFTSMHSVAETFTHRPLMHRFLTEAVFRPVWLLVGGDRVAFEMALRVVAMVLCGIACGLLWFGLRRRVTRLASPISVATWAALILCSTGVAWEPDWLAIVFTVAGIGVALLGLPAGPDRTGGHLGWPIVAGVLLAVAATIKYLTLPIALIGLLAILLVDQPGDWHRPQVRLRGWRSLRVSHPVFLITLASAVVTGVLWIVAQAAFWPWEIRWMLDASQMQPRRPLADHVALTFELLGNAMIMWPAVALIPASLVRATRTEKVIVWSALVLAWIPVPAQQQYFPYHAAALPVIAAIALVTGVRRGGSWLAVYALVGALGSVVVLTQLDSTSRVEWMWPLFGVWALYGAIGALVQRRRIHAFPERRTRALSALAAAVGVVTLVPISLPTAPWSVTLNPSRDFSTQHSLDENIGLFASGQRIRDAIGPDTPVLYLAFGDQVFAVGNPTFCQFPTNVFVQRGEWEKPILTTRTYADNLACLDDPRNKYLVWDKEFVTERRQPPEVIDRIRRNFNCDNAPVHNVLTLCPRR